MATLRTSLLVGGVDGAGFGCGYALALVAILDASANERGEQRVRCERLGFKLRMELAAEEPGMVGSLDDLHVHTIGRASGDAEAGARQRIFILAIEFVAMAMAL